jgi:hypothetical protein
VRLIKYFGGANNMHGMIFPFPVPIAKHKIFLSYFHKEDQYYKNRFELLFGDIFINKSVGDGDIDSDVSTDYIKRLIQEDYVRDASVIIVLVGRNTWCRRHVDWEISAALNKKVGGYSGLLGLCLPNHPAFGKSNYEQNAIPGRLHDNIKSKYALLYDWTEDKQAIKTRVELAFNNRAKLSEFIDNSRPQMKQNRSHRGPLETLLGFRP